MGSKKKQLKKKMTTAVVRVSRVTKGVLRQKDLYASSIGLDGGELDMAIRLNV